jgi:hypothetical protein
MTKSAILIQQRALFRQVDRHINCNFPDDSTIVASEITEANFPNLKFVINDIKNSDNPIKLIKIGVYLIKKPDNKDEGPVRDIVPLNVPGLKCIVRSTMENSEEVALENGELTKHTYYSPFLNGFGRFETEDGQPQQKGATISELIDIISKYNFDMPNTKEYNKRYTLVCQVGCDDVETNFDNLCMKSESQKKKEKKCAMFW